MPVSMLDMNMSDAQPDMTHNVVLPRHVWGGLIVAVIVVCAAIVFSLYGANPRFHEVWQYTPEAVPTLSFVAAVMERSPVLVPSNHMTWFGVWASSIIISSPKWIVMLLYLGATVCTTVSAYIVFYVRGISVRFAVLGAIAFGLLPARFDYSILANHWWMSMPIVLWWALTWWDGVSTPSSRYRIWAGALATALLLALSGIAVWWWSSLVLITSAVLALLIHRTWRFVWCAGGMVAVAGMLLGLLYRVWPMPIVAGDAGLRLSALWIPSADHRVAWFAQLGRDFAALDVVHTEATYIGAIALLGLGVAVVSALFRVAGVTEATVTNRLLLVLGVMMIVANQRGLALSTYIFGTPQTVSTTVDIWFALIAIVVLLLMLHTHDTTRWISVVLCVVVLFDQIPQTNIMYQMMQRTVDVTVDSWRNGVWFGQARQASDVVTITGVSEIEPGFGRWSDADIADHIEVVVTDPISQSITLEIRARGVGPNIGAPIRVQIGGEHHTFRVTDTVMPYRLSFQHAQGNVIAIYPQPISEPPPGDSRRIGVFVQSIQVVTP